MPYKILEQNGIDNENVDGAALNRFVAGGRDGIIKGVLSECALSGAGNGVGIAPGLILMCGIRVKIIDMETLFLSSAPLTAMQWQIIVRATLQRDRKVSVNFLLRAPGELRQDALYATESGVYEVKLGSFVHNPDGSISNLIRTLDVITGGGDCASSIEVGDVNTTTLAPGMDAAFDVTLRTDEQTGKTLLDFTAEIPRGADGTDNAAREALTKTANKSFYNLGIYDTITSNGDGTATITRKTGYAYFNGSEDWEVQSTINGNYRMIMHNGINNVTAKQLNDGDLFFKSTANEITAGQSWSGNAEGIGIENVENEGHRFNVVYFANRFNNANTLNDFKKFLAENPIAIQYELASECQYGEKVIENQPIHTLPQEGEQWAQEEWEKGLNLIDKTGNIFNGDICDENPNLSAGLYTIQVFTSYENATIALGVWTASHTLVRDIGLGANTPHTFYWSDKDVSAGNHLVVWSDSTIGTFKIMLNKGSFLYPYQPYYGGIVRVGDFDRLILERDYPVGGNKPYIQFPGMPTPAERWAGTTWEIDTAYQGRTLIGSGGEYAFGATGGSADAVVVSHTHKNDIVGISANTTGHGGFTFSNTWNKIQIEGPYDWYGAGTYDAGITGESGVGKNMPPHIVANYWKRTA